MVASRQVESPFFRGIGWLRGWGFSALGQVIGRTAGAFLLKYFVPAAKRVGADLMEFAGPEKAKAFSGRKDLKTAAKRVWEDGFWEDSWVVVVGKGLQGESFQ